MREALLAIATFVSVVLAAFLIAISFRDVESGRIDDKRHSDSHTETRLHPICVGKGRISYYMLTVYVPEYWELHLLNGDEAGWRKVTEQEYESYKVGDWYPRAEAE